MAKEVYRFTIDVRSKDDLGELAELINNVGRNLKQSGEKIRYFAYHDSLTRLPNRRLSSEYLKHALAQSENGSSGTLVSKPDCGGRPVITD